MTSINYRVGNILLVVGVGYLLPLAPCAFAASPASDCKNIASVEIPGTTIVTAELVEAGTFKTPSGFTGKGTRASFQPAGGLAGGAYHCSLATTCAWAGSV